MADRSVRGSIHCPASCLSQRRSVVLDQIPRRMQTTLTRGPATISTGCGSTGGGAYCGQSSRSVGACPERLLGPSCPCSQPSVIIYQPRQSWPRRLAAIGWRTWKRSSCKVIVVAQRRFFIIRTSTFGGLLDQMANASLCSARRNRLPRKISLLPQMLPLQPVTGDNVTASVAGRLVVRFTNLSPQAPGGF